MSAEAQTVVLIHGMWMTPRSWDDWSITTAIAAIRRSHRAGPA
jgi:hypothetical protein